MATTRAEVQRIVADLLRSVTVEAPPVPVDQVATYLRAQVRKDYLGGDLSGILFKDGDNIIIGVNSSHSPNRQRFTIAHEIGHLMLHDRDKLHIDRRFLVRLRNTRSSQAIDPDEIAANAFAAELLMPTPFLRRDLKGILVDYEDDKLIHTLAERYEVSLQAMIFRLVNLGYIDQAIDVQP